MGKCIIMTGGTGGIDPDELTADPADVLKGKIAGVRDNDDPVMGTLELTGTAADSQVLAGQTYYNTDAKIKHTGSMANRGTISASLNAGESYTVPTGYHTGSGKVTANSLAGQTSATASAGHILSGQTAWVNGSKITGNIASMGGQTITPGAVQQTISCVGKYMTGNMVISAVSRYQEKQINIITSASIKSFYSTEWAVYNLYYAEYTGYLGFTPRLIVATSGSDVAYSAIFDTMSNVCYTNPPRNGPYVYYMTISGSPNMYANSNGFCIPVGSDSMCRNSNWLIHLIGY